MNIKNNFLLFFSFWLALSPLSLHANDFIDACAIIINVTTNGALDHLKENGPKYIGVAVSAGITAIVTNAINKRSNNTTIDSKQIEELKYLFVIKDKKDQQAQHATQNQLDTILKILDNHTELLNLQAKREVIQQAERDFHECLRNTNNNYKACASQKEAFEQARDKLLNDILNNSTIKEAL